MYSDQKIIYLKVWEHFFLLGNNVRVNRDKDIKQGQSSGSAECEVREKHSKTISGVA